MTCLLIYLLLSLSSRVVTKAPFDPRPRYLFLSSIKLRSLFKTTEFLSWFSVQVAKAIRKRNNFENRSRTIWIILCKYTYWWWHSSWLLTRGVRSLASELLFSSIQEHLHSAHETAISRWRKLLSNNNIREQKIAVKIQYK